MGGPKSMGDTREGRQVRGLGGPAGAGRGCAGGACGGAGERAGSCAWASRFGGVGGGVGRGVKGARGGCTDNDARQQGPTPCRNHLLQARGGSRAGARHRHALTRPGPMRAPPHLGHLGHHSVQAHGAVKHGPRIPRHRRQHQRAAGGRQRLPLRHLLGQAAPHQACRQRAAPLGSCRAARLRESRSGGVRVGASARLLTPPRPAMHARAAARSLPHAGAASPPACRPALPRTLLPTCTSASHTAVMPEALR
jgi:hypothetical protein